MDYQQIKFTVENHVATLTLNRPEAYNAFSDVMRNEMRDAFSRVEADKDIRALILTGEGKAFCSGGDVKLMVSRMESGMPFAERREIFRKDVKAVVEQIYNTRVPVIAAINGGAYGAGASLSLLCDVRIAADNAKFGFLFGKRGLIPDWGSNYTLPRVVGLSRAIELVASGRIFGAQEALSYGLVNQVVEAGKLMEAATGLAAQIAANSPNAVAESKLALRLGMSQTLSQALEHEAMTQSLCQLSDDHREGVMSFVEKREPVF